MVLVVGDAVSLASFAVVGDGELVAYIANSPSLLGSL